VSVSLALSTLTGVYMAYKFDRKRWQLAGLLAAGIVVPLVLLPF
jgi:ABC-type molybdate transport system permease subunit